MNPYHTLPVDFYARDTETVARQLLGKLLVREIAGVPLVGKIVETEAYIGENDPASHAFRGKTARTALMFGPPGLAYIYFIYGMYYCLNVVTEAPGFPAAVLIRAVEPLAGIEIMKKNRRKADLHTLTNGPGKLCQAFAIDTALNGQDLSTPPLWIAHAPAVPAEAVVATTRVGIRRGKEFPWRFYIKRHPFVSKP